MGQPGGQEPGQASSVWSAVVDEAGLAARRMHQVLDGGSDRQAVLSRFVAELSPDEEKSLRTRLGPDASRDPGSRPGN
ncbi:BlaI/MecI/CopY family transcriptional regulator [Streptomyces sp. NPDC020681]|uniref:BlaI/MecI/CopY family transcriptional regulator n=1 Tax=Streptomyces sp. NPDC020681 TaxID=3365083 RepID=UPI00379A355F